MYFKTNPLNHKSISFLLFIISCTWFSSAFATDAAWVFAHRTNTVEAVEAADRDQGINAIEIDITHRTLINRNKIEDCKERWCAFHKGDSMAKSLTDILKEARDSENIHAVWLDVKSVDMRPQAYRILIDLVNKELGAKDGRPELRKFWGAYHNATDTNYLRQLVFSFGKLRPIRNSSIIFEINRTVVNTTIWNTVDPNGEIRAGQVNQFCNDINIQCGLSAGIFNTGSLLSNDGQKINLLDDKKRLSNINSVFMWTFNWVGYNEDDMMRLLFLQRNYWERMESSKYYCGQEGNGVIVGYAFNMYNPDFCRTADQGDACSFANEQIINGPNNFGNLYSDIGSPSNGNGYTTSDCH